MPTRRIDDETIAVIQAHWSAAHDGEIDALQIAIERKGRPADVTRVTVIPETRQSPTWFICRACPGGLQRYRTDLGADPKHPPVRHERMIRAHLKEAHRTTGAAASRIVDAIGTDSPVVYLPALRAGAPKYQCDLCPTGYGLRMLDDPAYGDARSFWELSRNFPEEARRINRLPARERAIHWEAVHRGIEVVATTWLLARAIREEREAKPDIAIGDLELGLRRLMLNYVSRGTQVTDVTASITHLMSSDPIAYACELARAIPGWERHLNLPCDEIAALIDGRYGPLTRDKRTLWRYWTRIPPSVRHKAEGQGEEHRAKTCQ